MIFIDRKFSDELDFDDQFDWLEENIQGQFEYINYIIKNKPGIGIAFYDRWKFEKYQDALAFKMCFGGELVCEFDLDDNKE